MASTSWREQLLAGLQKVPIIGVPGTLVVYGERALPILTGNSPTDVIMAAAELGQGRVVVFTHDGYTKSFYKNDDDNLSLLFKNVKIWLSRGCSVEQEEICDIEGINTFDNSLPQEVRILAWSGLSQKPTSFTEQVLSFVESGGGLVCGMTPWGWLQLNPGCNLSNMPHFKVLKAIGIAYTDDYVCTTGNEITVSDNHAKTAHLSEAVSLCAEQPTSSSHIAVLSKGIGYLPDDAKAIVAHVLSDLMSTTTPCFPCQQHPLETDYAKCAISVQDVLGTLQGSCYKAAGIEHFPGDFPDIPPVKTTILSFVSGREDWRSTGCYLPAGGQATLTLQPAQAEDALWYIRIGCHTDNLRSISEPLKRWPVITKTEPLKKSPLHISSPYGGLLYVKCCEGAQDIEVKLEGVVDAPFFDLTSPGSVKAWETRRRAPGLWADLAGEFITFTLPSNSVRDIVDPSPLLQCWDRVVRAHHDLRGSDANRAPRQHVVMDVQPSCGYMHSGYPIVATLRFGLNDKITDIQDFILHNDAGRLHGTTWGLYHEIGHNMQRDSWTFDGTVEVTCNIFTLHASDVISGIPPLAQPWLRAHFENMRRYLCEGGDYDSWKADPGVGLGLYAQLAVHFGWGAFKKVFRQYETMAEDQKPRDNQAKIDTWFTCFSVVVQHDLSPMFEFWALPLSVQAKETMKHLKSFLPEDEITALAPRRVAEVLAKKENVVRVISPIKDEFVECHGNLASV